MQTSRACVGVTRRAWSWARDVGASAGLGQVGSLHGTQAAAAGRGGLPPRRGLERPHRHAGSGRNQRPGHGTVRTAGPQVGLRPVRLLRPVGHTGMSLPCGQPHGESPSAGRSWPTVTRGSHWARTGADQLARTPAPGQARGPERRCSHRGAARHALCLSEKRWHHPCGTGASGHLGCVCRLCN